MEELWDVLQIMGVGILAIIGVIFTKIDDLNQSNPNFDFATARNMFMKKGKASYLASLTFLLIYALTHDQWATVFVGPDSKGLVSRILGMQIVMGFFIAGGFQWGYYKFFMRKTDKILKNWIGDDEPKKD